MDTKEHHKAMPSANENWSAITPERVEELLARQPAPAIGYLQWVKHYHSEGELTETIEALKARGIEHVRTGISWAEWLESDGKERICRYIAAFAEHFEVLPCLTFTPLQLGVAPLWNSPPKNFLLYGDFVESVIAELGEHFLYLELWNEWDIETDWDVRHDPEYKTFASMIALGAQVAHRYHKRVVLGGMSNVNERSLHELEAMAALGLREVVDVVGFHNLRGSWHDRPMPPLSNQAQSVHGAWGQEVPLWLTEYGFSVLESELADGRTLSRAQLEDIQVAVFAYAVYALLTGAVERVYWFTYKDEVHESLRFVTTGWEDISQHYYGDTTEHGDPRKLARLLRAGGPANVLRTAVREGLLHLVDEAALKRKL